uniref:Uncharacterized protein n=1 Tax=Panagrolaimus sp. PS1159 TaxID=55785 RepID=A0AC35FEM1_9BILA
MVDVEISKLSTDSILNAEKLRQHFLLSVGIDHFGFILFWGTRYKPEKSSTPSDEKPSCNNNATQNSNISDPPPFVIKEEDSITESTNVADKAPLPPPSENVVVKNEAEKEDPITESTNVADKAPLPPSSENVVVKNEAESESSFICSNAKEVEEKEEK